MDLTIMHNGQPKGTLNQALINRNKVTPEKVEKIKELHQKKWKIFDEMEVEKSRDILRAYAKLVETIEYELQSLWGFAKDKNYHEWYKVPQCQCPKIDNDDRNGTPYQIYNKSCPIHGD